MPRRTPSCRRGFRRSRRPPSRGSPPPRPEGRAVRDGRLQARARASRGLVSPRELQDRRSSAAAAFEQLRSQVVAGALDGTLPAAPSSRRSARSPTSPASRPTPSPAPTGSSRPRASSRRAGAAGRSSPSRRMRPSGHCSKRRASTRPMRDRSASTPSGLAHISTRLCATSRSGSRRPAPTSRGRGCRSGAR